MTDTPIHPSFTAAISALDTEGNRLSWEQSERAQDSYGRFASMSAADVADAWLRHLRSRASVAEDRFGRWAKAVPTRFKAAHLGELSTEQHPDEMRRWASDEKSMTLLIAGPPGRGKTHAAYALAHSLAARVALYGPSMPQAWTVPGLLDALRPSSDRADGVWEAVKTTGLLLLDDLANVRATDWSIERMWLLADARSANDLRTIITTNASWADLEATWGIPTMDRWRDRSAIVKFSGDSLRAPAW